MNISVFLIECGVLCAAFGALVIAMLLINPLIFIIDYPPEIQARYYALQQKEAAKGVLTKINLAKKAVFIVLGLLLFAWMAHIAGAATFWRGFAAACGYMAAVSVFDVIVLDWIIFPNVRRMRLPGTEDMDAEYRQKWFHVKVMLPALPAMASGALISAGIMVWIW